MKKIEHIIKLTKMLLIVYYMYNTADINMTTGGIRTDFYKGTLTKAYMCYNDYG